MKFKYPELSGPDYQKARIYMLQNKFDEALKSVNLSITLNQDNYYSMNLKGIILRELGQFKKAKSAYEAAIDSYPLYANSHLSLGMLEDLYFGKLSAAYIQYKVYMKLVKGDKQVANWVIEIKQRMKAGE